MEKVRSGKTGMMVSKLGFGGIPIQRVSEEEAPAVVKRCLELGINFIDTANAYANSEERIGKAISGRQEGLILATKSTSRSREGMEMEGMIKHLPSEALFSGWIADGMERAVNCTKCGDCEERCPYGLPIREMLEAYSNLYQAEKRKFRRQTG